MICINICDDFYEIVTKKLIKRYKEMSKKSIRKEKICDMLNVLENDSEDWPIDKTNRWIGFVQGILFSEDLLNINEERDFTRPLFHEYYLKTKQDIPKSVDTERKL